MTDLAPLLSTHNGTQTWIFEQLSSAQRKKRKGTGTVWGLCWALSLEWVRSEKTGNPLMNKIGSEGNLNDVVYKQIINNQKTLNTSLAYKVEEGAIANMGLACNKLNTGKYSKERKSEMNESFSTQMRSVIGRVADQKYGIIDIYSRKIINVTPSHVMAISTHGGIFKFFDPVKGQFEFNNKSNFMNFIAAYMDKMYNGVIMNFQKDFRVRQFSASN
ncbi:MAG: YopT-type cysteine protease domain-containing protein [Paracoccaceae bacterium]